MSERVLLLGAGGKTGESYARLLQLHGHHVLWYDKNPKQIPTNLDPKLLTHVAHDALNFSHLKDRFDLLTLTPGVPLQQPFIVDARAAGKPVISEVAYTASYLADFTIIGVTGTDGKSTTTTLIAQILRQIDLDAIECGNFGIPLSEMALEKEKYSGKILVCELSSYQLEEPGALKLAAGIFLNLAPDHLNRYSSLAEYGLAKWNIIKLLRENAPLLVADNLTAPGESGHPLSSFKNSLITIDVENLISPHYRIEEKNLLSSTGAILADLAESAIAGRHNYSNLLFALETVRAVGGDEITAKLAAALRTLKSLPHRFEFIPQTALPQITFINDSKATTTQATMTALRNTQPPVFIFLGGQGKGERYGDLGKLLAEMKAHACIYGECKNDMAADFQAVGFSEFTLHENLFKAFHTAKRMVIQRKLTGATLLLSPAVTSWDQFASFEARGDYFRSLVASLVQIAEPLVQKSDNR
jgi:UDP-N-acetylmuramoylalanine--D-glutamate ligase